MSAAAFFSRLHIRLLLLILICVAPAFAVIVYSSLEQRSKALLDAEQQAIGAARQLAARQRDLLAHAHQLLDSLTRSPEVRGLTPAKDCNRALREIGRLHSYYVDLFVADAAGWIRCSANPPEGRVNVADRSYFRRARETQDLAIGDFQRSRISGEETVFLAHPLPDSADGFAGMVAVGIDPLWLSTLMADISLPAGSVVTLVDSRGTILARMPDPAGLIGQQINEAGQFQATLARHGAMTVESLWLDGVRRVAGIMPVFNASGDLFVRVGIPSAAAYAHVERSFYRDLGLLAAAALFVFALGWLASHRLVLRRVADLSATAHRLGQGDLDARTLLAPDHGELGQLASTLDEMAAGLQQRQARIAEVEQELRRSNRALRVLIGVTRLLGQADDEARLLDDLCQVIVEVGGYCMAWVGYAENDAARSVRPQAHAGFEAAYLATLRLSWGEGELGQGPSGTAIRTGETCVVRDIASDPRYAIWREAALSRGYASSISIPLGEGEAFGVLTVMAGEPAAFDPEEAALLGEAARELAFGIRAMRAGSERRRLEAALYLRNRAIEASHNGLLIVELGEDLRVASVNSALMRLICADRCELIGKHLGDLGNCCGVSADGLARLSERIRAGQAGDFSMSLTTPAGERCWLDVSLGLVSSEQGGCDHALVEFRDVTVNRRYQEQIEYQAKYDFLTGLPNRHLLVDHLRQALAQPAPKPDLFVYWLDVDRMQAVNQSLGREAGDLVLRTLGERLVLVAGGHGLLARPESDSFVLVAAGAAGLAAAALGEKLRAAVCQPMRIDGHDLVLTASVGIAAAPADAEAADLLLRNAGLAMLRAKENGWDSLCFYNEEMDAEAVPRLRLEIGLRQALERDELFLVYQPKAALPAGGITGAEALVRWRHPELGLVSPAEFIPVAEGCGLILPIGRWVMEKACAQMRAWLDEGLDCPPVAVNVSPQQFFRDDIVGQVEELLAAYRLDPALLMIEITEGTLMRDPERAIRTMLALKEVGIKLAIDDFGTGYSSLSALKRFPIDYLKIDRSFVSDLTVNASDAAIAMAVISLARSLGLRVIAEGVETPEQLAYLSERGCDEMQGYLFSPPVPAASFADLLRSLRRELAAVDNQ